MILSMKQGVRIRDAPRWLFAVTKTRLNETRIDHNETEMSCQDDEVSFVEAVQQHSRRRMFHRYISSNVLITSQVFKHPLL